MVPRLLRHWYVKLWWVHAEALYALALAGRLTDDEGMGDRYAQLHEYTFSTFPNSDTRVGEWIQVRDRAGRPGKTEASLPVKDPYHHWRALMLLIELAEQMPAGSGE